VSSPVTAEQKTQNTEFTLWDLGIVDNECVDSENGNAFLTDWDDWNHQGNMVSVAEASSLFPPSLPEQVDFLTGDMLGAELLPNLDAEFESVHDAVLFDLAPGATATQSVLSQSLTIAEAVGGSGPLGDVSGLGFGESRRFRNAAASRPPQTRDRMILPSPVSLTSASSPSARDSTSSSPASTQSASSREENGPRSRAKKA